MGKDNYHSERKKIFRNYRDDLKVALVHDWFLHYSIGGAEKVTKEIDNILTKNYNTPDIFSIVESINDKNKDFFDGRDINTTFIQNLPFGKKYVQNYLPLIPFAIEQIDLRKYRLIISSSHLASKGVLTSPDQLHISYIHTPMRYAWDQMNIYLERSKISKFGLRFFVRYLLYKLREWDFVSGGRSDYLIANSTFTARRIKKYWGLSSTVIHPPVEVERFTFNKTREEFYLSVCRLVPNKRIDLLISSFNKLGLQLYIIGQGPELKKLKKEANSNIKFLGKQPNNVVEDLMSRCRAFIYPGVEDFGITPIEAMASGAPIIAFARGGILDSVNCIRQCPKNKLPTGLFFHSQTQKSIYETVRWFEDNEVWKLFNSQILNAHAKNFSTENFIKKFEAFIENAFEEFSKNNF